MGRRAIFGAAAILLSVALVAGAFLVGRSSVDEGISQQQVDRTVSRAVHRAAQKASERTLHREYASEQKLRRQELPGILRELGQVGGAKLLSPPGETKEALILIEEALYGEIKFLAPILVKFNPNTGKPDGLNGEFLTPAEAAAAREGVREGTSG